MKPHMSKVQVLKLPDNELAVKFKLPLEAIAVVKELQKRREQLGENMNWRPLWENINEVAVVYYMSQQNKSLTAKILGISDKTLERLEKSIENEKQIAIFSPSEYKVVKIPVEKEKLLEIIQTPSEDIEKLLEKYEYLYEKTILTKFMTIKQFLENPVRVEQRSKETHYSDDQINETLRAIASLLTYLKRNRDKYKIPLNIDHWNKEHELELARAITDMCVLRGYTSEKKLRACKGRVMGSIRRIKRFYDMGLFSGMIGRVTQRVEPRSEFMNLSQYKTLHEQYKKTNDKNYKAWFETSSLHLLTGSREGYASVIRKAKKLIKIASNNNNINIYAIDLDDPLVETSLVGIKWDNVVFTEDNDIVIKIYESKTGETWILSGCWLGSWFVEILKERYEHSKQHGIKSVVKTILHYYGINKFTVGAFEIWYSHYTAKYTSELIGVRLNPHRIRASHISILYELGIPLEIIVKKEGGFGVGWSDLSTAVEFYWRLTSQRVREYMNRAKEITSKTLA